MEQKNATIIVFYWIAFILSCLATFLNVGLVLLVFGIFILALFGLHFFIGLKLQELRPHKKTIVLSSINLLLFSLVRIDGVHVTNGNGLSTLFAFFDIHIGVGSEWENIFFLVALILFFLQLYLEIHLFNHWKSLNRQG